MVISFPTAVPAPTQGIFTFCSGVLPDLSRGPGTLSVDGRQDRTSFPYVSPAVSLPTDPPRRVVDAGYYDNYGVEVATAWIYQNRSWLTKHRGRTPRQIRDSISVKERLDVAEAPVSFWETASRGFQFFTSPIDGVSSARSSSSSFRNDREVEFLGDVFENLTRDKVKEPKRFFSTVIFENSASVTLNPPPEWPDKPEAASAGVPRSMMPEPMFQ